MRGKPDNFWRKSILAEEEPAQRSGGGGVPYRLKTQEGGQGSRREVEGVGVRGTRRH